MEKHTTFFRDPGSHGVKDGHLLPRSHFISLRCADCGHLQYESKNAVNHRASMRRCDKCGGFLDYTKSSRKKNDFSGVSLKSGVFCRRCKCKLRSSNSGPYCSPCQDFLDMKFLTDSKNL